MNDSYSFFPHAAYLKYILRGIIACLMYICSYLKSKIQVIICCNLFKKC